MSGDSQNPVAPACSEDELSADADHRAILARRDLLMAVAMTGLLASCDGNSSSAGSKGGDAAPPTQDAAITITATPFCAAVSTDGESTDSACKGVDGADDGDATLEAGDTAPSSICVCVY
jgi:hypothetical protein